MNITFANKKSPTCAGSGLVPTGQPSKHYFKTALCPMCGKTLGINARTFEFYPHPWKN